MTTYLNKPDELITDVLKKDDNDIELESKLLNQINDIDIKTKNIDIIKNIPFWTSNPNILFNPTYILEIYPINNMTFEQKLNAITRLIILLTIIFYSILKNNRLIIVSVFSIFCIFLFYYNNNKDKSKLENNKKKQIENFDNSITNEVLEQNNKNIDINNVFDNPNSSNPYSNVLMTDYDYNPNKKPAPPIYNSNVNKIVIEKTKDSIQEINNNHPNINNSLFKDLGEELNLEHSMRQFYSNPNTTIPNDQQSFSEFCYGSMVSCKEGNLFACARNLNRPQLY